MLDEYLFGTVKRISPEAPVPVVHFQKEVAYPGGAANVARNLAAFGIFSEIAGLIGDDVRGRQLLTLLKHPHLGTRGVLVDPKFMTIRKTRVMARQQQLLRVDREEPPLPLSPTLWKKFTSFLEKAVPQVDGVILQDYGKGLITQKLVDWIAPICQKHRTIITVDPNVNNPLNWSGMTVVKPNRQEAFSAAGLNGNLSLKPAEAIQQVGRTLLEKWRVEHILMTLGEEGMMLFSQRPRQEMKNAVTHIPTRAREVYDVSGAGDTAIAFFTAALASGLNAHEAADLANHAAGVVVGKLGTATVSADELIDSFVRNGNGTPSIL